MSRKATVSAKAVSRLFISQRKIKNSNFNFIRFPDYLFFGNEGSNRMNIFGYFLTILAARPTKTINFCYKGKYINEHNMEVRYHKQNTKLVYH